MTRFFSTEVSGDSACIVGEDARHCNVLRLDIGDKLILCDGKRFDYECEISNISKDRVDVRVLKKYLSGTELDVGYYIYCAYPKSDKAEQIVQKATELGAAGVYFFPSRFCVAKYDDTSKKRERWQKIAREAAQQSGRGIIPEVKTFTDFKAAMQDAATKNLTIFCYENEQNITLNNVINKSAKSVAIITGAEGGFSEDEVEIVKSLGHKVVTLGKRILRCETAPIAVLAALTLR